jgi:hypothetical protein
VMPVIPAPMTAICATKGLPRTELDPAGEPANDPHLSRYLRA